MFYLTSFLTSFLCWEESALGELTVRGSLSPGQPPSVPVSSFKTPRDLETRIRDRLTYLDIVAASHGSLMVRTDLFRATSLRETTLLGYVFLTV